jgi:succinate dehydrogenase/fumarate reductase flavoprotein subunit
MVARLQATMADHVGPFRTGAKLGVALDEISTLTAELGEHPSGHATAFDLERLEWFDLRNMLTVAQAVTAAALARSESRGAHQREDFQTMLPQWQVHQRVQLRDGALKISGAPTAAKALAS